jgi:hypothetical protein
MRHPTTWSGQEQREESFRGLLDQLLRPPAKEISDRRPRSNRKARTALYVAGKYGYVIDEPLESRFEADLRNYEVNRENFNFRSRYLLMQKDFLRGAMLNGRQAPLELRVSVMGEKDPSNPTPLGEPERLGSSSREAQSDSHKLPEVVHGRMLCVAHGRMCYRRISRVGVSEWICPDERHRMPIKSS